MFEWVVPATVVELAVTCEQLEGAVMKRLIAISQHLELLEVKIQDLDRKLDSFIAAWS